MSRTTTMTVRLGGALSDFVSANVGDDGSYENVSEYIRDLIRRDKERAEQEAFNRLKGELTHAFAAPGGDVSTADGSRGDCAEQGLIRCPPFESRKGRPTASMTSTATPVTGGATIRPRNTSPACSQPSTRSLSTASHQSPSRPSSASNGFFFRYERHFVYWRHLSNGDIGIVTILHERMHQIDRFRDDFGLG